ncbi:MAG: DNA replication/repair protein RecF [Crocinitomicaceae bacterium]|nr:DNA replication/repair protein RecF [Crocinitomicaceae bacterium]
MKYSVEMGTDFPRKKCTFGAMHIEKLSIVNFKNYRQVEVELASEINCFVGSNGAGKTNLLDAVHYLSMCRSYLNPIDSQNILFDEQFFVIQGLWRKDEVADQLFCGVKRGTKKVFKKNKVQYEKLAEHIGSYPSVMISPYDRNLISEGSELRRKWMDGIIAQFDRHFLDDLIKYGKVLDQRNALLKNMAEFGFFNRESMEVWDAQLVTYGQRIYRSRSTFLEEFIGVFQKYYDDLSDQKETVGLEYKSHLLEGDFLEQLKLAEGQDHRKQFTTIGIHKDDLIFTINGHPVKRFGSQGQQKSYLIALKLAQFEWLTRHLKVKPIMLLDDIFDKLDNKRVGRLMELVSDNNFGQVLVTDTDEERVKRIFDNIQLPFKLFKVHENEVTVSQKEIVEE